MFFIYHTNKINYGTMESYDGSKLVCEHQRTKHTIFGNSTNFCAIYQDLIMPYLPLFRYNLIEIEAAYFDTYLLDKLNSGSTCKGTKNIFEGFTAGPMSPCI